MLFVGTSIIHPSTEGVFLLCNILDLLIYRIKHKICYNNKRLFGGERIRKVYAGHNGVLILERGKVYDKTGKIEAEIWRWIRHIYITAA